MDAHSHLWGESLDDIRMSLGRRVRIKTDEEVELIRLSSLLVGRTLAEVAARYGDNETILVLAQLLQRIKMSSA